MFMQIAVGAIGIGVILLVGFVVVSQVRTALPSSATVQVNNPCLGYSLSNTAQCNASSLTTVGGESVPGPLTDNTTQFLTVSNEGFSSGTSSVQVTVFAGFGLVAVGIIVLAAFGLINVFQ